MYDMELYYAKNNTITLQHQSKHSKEFVEIPATRRSFDAMQKSRVFLLDHVTQMLEKYKIRYVITSGTLIGYERARDFMPCKLCENSCMLWC